MTLEANEKKNINLIIGLENDCNNLRNTDRHTEHDFRELEQEFSRWKTVCILMVAYH